MSTFDKNSEFVKVDGRIGIITNAQALSRIVLHLDDWTYGSYHFSELEKIPQPKKISIEL